MRKLTQAEFSYLIQFYETVLLLFLMKSFSLDKSALLYSAWVERKLMVLILANIGKGLSQRVALFYGLILLLLMIEWKNKVSRLSASFDGKSPNTFDFENPEGGVAQLVDHHLTLRLNLNVFKGGGWSLTGEKKPYELLPAIEE